MSEPLPGQSLALIGWHQRFDAVKVEMEALEASEPHIVRPGDFMHRFNGLYFRLRVLADEWTELDH